MGRVRKPPESRRGDRACAPFRVAIRAAGGHLDDQRMVCRRRRADHGFRSRRHEKKALRIGLASGGQLLDQRSDLHRENLGNAQVADPRLGLGRAKGPACRARSRRGGARRAFPRQCRRPRAQRRTDCGEPRLRRRRTGRFRQRRNRETGSVLAAPSGGREPFHWRRPLLHGDENRDLHRRAMARRQCRRVRFRRPRARRPERRRLGGAGRQG